MWRIEADRRASPRRTMESSRQWKTPELKTANGRRNKMFGSYNYTAIYVASPVIYSVSDYYFYSQGCKLAVITEMRNWMSSSLECNSDACARSINMHLHLYSKGQPTPCSSSGECTKRSATQQASRLSESECYLLQRSLRLENCQEADKIRFFQ